MSTQNPDGTEQAFFAALLDGDVGALRELLSHDFVMVDVLTGSEVLRDSLLEVVGTGQLRFDRIERFEHRVRLYGTAAVITGRTEMLGRFGDQTFQAQSRYTHMFVTDGETWRMVSAQGTQIAPGPVAT